MLRDPRLVEFSRGRFEIFNDQLAVGSQLGDFVFTVRDDAFYLGHARLPVTRCCADNGGGAPPDHQGLLASRHHHQRNQAINPTKTALLAITIRAILWWVSQASKPAATHTNSTTQYPNAFRATLIYASYYASKVGAMPVHGDDYELRRYRHALGHSHAAPRTPDESPCAAGSTGVVNTSEKTYFRIAGPIRS